MFTINIYLKLALIAICFIGGAILAYAYGFWYAFPFFLIGLGLLASYIFLGTIQSSAQLMQEQDFEGAENRLKLTLKPNWLYVTNRAYYHLIKGSCAMQRGDTDNAEKSLATAQSIKLPSDNEKAMILLQLISIHIQKNRWTQANHIYRELKSLNISLSMIKDQMKMIDDVMKQQGKAKMMNTVDQRMMFRPGGKRRMPRMR
ncbi:MAG TPA: hypothetical protein PK006_03675 [Saprospiraceae bacterium]|nr:hypothetical protein [Saprospiraceae bacterium]